MDRKRIVIEENGMILRETSTTNKFYIYNKKPLNAGNCESQILKLYTKYLTELIKLGEIEDYETGNLVFNHTLGANNDVSVVIVSGVILKKGKIKTIRKPF